MKDLFAGILSVSISGSLLICIAILIRLIFKKAPKAILCGLWLVLILRLLLPLQLEAPWSLRPDLPVFTGQDTQLFIEAKPVMEGEIPAIIPQARVEGDYLVLVDYLKIGTILWALGVCFIGVYTLISYFRLKFWVREAILKEKGVYVSANVETAFLLGYFRPRIYLPSTIGEKESQLVTTHERVHIKRGDNWLKLLGFICLALHWFNPLMWIAYGMLCKDIEDACDARVVRDLDAEERKIYSEALLTCGQKSRKVFGCPVAFGEISIKQRILNILNYKKPATWLTIALVVVIIFVTVFMVPDPIKQVDPPYYETLRDLVGQPVDVVCEALDLQETELVVLGARTGLYDTPLIAEYQGVEFKVRLGFSIYNELLTSFTYYKLYDGEHEQVAQDVVAVSNRLWDNFGKGYQWYENEVPKRLKNDTAEDVLARYSERGRSSIAYDQWNLTHQATKPVKTWLDQIEVSYLWRETHGDMAQRYGVSPHYFMEFNATYDKDTDRSQISMGYHTGWQPGHYGTFVGSDYR